MSEENSTIESQNADEGGRQMILYATTQTIQRYKLKMPDELSPKMSELAYAIIERDAGSLLREWGLKLFYFDGRKCLQTVNFASKFTLFLFDIKMRDLENLGALMAQYMLDLYADDPEMTKCLLQMFEQDQFVAFAPLKNRSMIATLNHTQSDYAFDGARFWEYVDNGILHTRKINWDVNFNYAFTHKAVGQKEYYFPAELFREQVVRAYGCC